MPIVTHINYTHLINRQLIRIPLGNAFLTLIDDRHLNVRTFGRHHAARGTAHVAGANAADFRNTHHVDDDVIDADDRLERLR